LAVFDSHFSAASTSSATGLYSYYYFFDGNGNVGQLLKAVNGEIRSHYEHSPFGNVITSFGDIAGDNPYRFSSKYFDEEIDSYYYGNRYYMPKTGNWLNRDPIEEEGGINLYNFVNNDSINYFDLFGLWKWKNGRRQGQSRAVVVAEKNGDTYVDLANLVGLDVKEVEKWLQEYVPNEKVSTNCEFSVPNTFVIATGNSLEKVDTLISFHIGTMMQDLMSRGFYVESFSREWGNTKESLVNGLVSDDVWGYTLYGHGGVELKTLKVGSEIITLPIPNGDVRATGSFIWDYDMGTFLVPEELNRKKFKYALGINGHCFANYKPWRDLSIVSHQGWFLYSPLLPPPSAAFNWGVLIERAAGRSK
jgi:RHS repeat-associated protein